MRSILEDPITLELMDDAVIGHCGHSFSQASIERWLREGSKRSCPLCKHPLALDQLRPNYSLRDAVAKFKADNGERPPTERRGLGFKTPIEDWSVADTKKWIENFDDWVEDSVMVEEHNINGKILSGMKEAELQEKLHVAPEHSKLLQIQIAKATTISKCLVDYAAFPSLNAMIDGTSSVEVTSSPPPSSSMSTSVDVEMGESEIRRERALEEDGPGCLRRWTNDAKESETGCCLFECADCFLCECSEGFYNCCHLGFYRALAALFCEHCGGKSASYGLRTFWGICFIPFAMIFLLALFVEAAFWLLVIVLAVACFLCVVAVLAAGSSRRR